MAGRICELCTKKADFHDGINDEYLCNEHLVARFKALGKPKKPRVYTLLTLDENYDQDKSIQTFSSKLEVGEYLKTLDLSEVDIGRVLLGGSAFWTSKDSENEDNMSIELFETDLL